MNDMNKKQIDAMLPKALEVLQNGKFGISQAGKINSAYRSAIAAFGAAMTMGSFKAAVSFFSKDAEDGKAGISRSKLLEAMNLIARGGQDNSKDILNYVIKCGKEEEKRLKRDFINAAVALKLAMNAFDLGKNDKKGDEGEGDKNEQS